MTSDKRLYGYTPRVQQVADEFVTFAEAVSIRKKDGIPVRQLGIKLEKVGVTDPVLGLQTNALLGGDGKSYELAEFPQAPPGARNGDPAPDVDRNPYNFVSLPPGGPWREAPDPQTGTHQGHACWRPDLLHGTINVILRAKSPIFVPGLPDSSRFYRLHRWSGENKRDHYAIPGSSFKGALRSMVEALVNDRFGVIQDPTYYQAPIPYRRRAFNVRDIRNELTKPYHVGKATNVGGDWSVIPIDYDRQNGFKECYPSNLLVQLAHHTVCTHNDITDGTRYQFADGVVDAYRRNLNHPHYARHYADWNAAYGEYLGKHSTWTTGGQRGPEPSVPKKPEYCEQIYRKGDAEADAELAAIKSKLQLRPEDIVFFTLNQQGKIDSFGKNVNYLWPSEHSIESLAGAWFPPSPGSGSLGLTQPLGLADLMFGFVSNHGTAGNGNRTHPFRGKVRVEPVWGPPYDEGNQPDEITLAVLTAPQSRAKCRPLYLEPGAKGLSASYSDVLKPTLRGRKFYWKQRTEDGQVWQFHRSDQNGSTPKDKQSRPKIRPLPPLTEFETRISFENLSAPELGALLFALLGPHPQFVAENGSWSSGEHCIHLGKGKSRGLGACDVEAAIRWFRPQERYASLASIPEAPPAADGEVQEVYRAFANWCERRARESGYSDKEFLALPYIRDFVQIHTWPRQASVRYYPVNWSQYSWTPKENHNPDEPKGKPRPKAMRLTRNLEP